MIVQVDVWLRGSEAASTHVIEEVSTEPREWCDSDVRAVIEGMLRAMSRLKHPDVEEHPVALRGISWIVNPFEGGGVVIAIEITMGAAVAGPFDIDKSALESMISRVLVRPAPSTTDTVH